LDIADCGADVRATMAASCPHLPRFMTLVAAAVISGLASGDSVRRRCDRDRYFDQVAQLCTACTDICDPARGTLYLCLKQVHECNGKLYSHKSRCL